MSVDGVQGSNVVTNTAVAAGIGAGVAGGSNYVYQKAILKNPAKYIKELKTRQDTFIKKLTASAKKNKMSKKDLNEVIKYTEEIFKKPVEYAQNLAKSGKVNWKEVGKRAGIGAVVVAGVYLAYRGVKALFSKKD